MIKQHSYITHTKKLSNISYIRGEIHVFIGFFMKKGFKIAILRFWPHGAVLGAANRQKCENFTFLIFFALFMYKCTKLGGPPQNPNLKPQNTPFPPTPNYSNRPQT